MRAVRLRRDRGRPVQLEVVLNLQSPLLAFGLLGSADEINLKIELELRFISEGKDLTRVELEHRRLDRYGARREEMRTIFDTIGDRGRLLQAFAEAAPSEGTS
jgi:hypothetical protein